MVAVGYAIYFKPLTTRLNVVVKKVISIQGTHLQKLIGRVVIQNVHNPFETWPWQNAIFSLDMII